MGGRVTVGVDPRIELLSALLLLSRWREHGVCREDYRYKREAASYFEPYSGHRAVGVLERALMYGLAGDAIVGLMMHLSEPPGLALRVPPSKYYLERARLLGGVDFIQELVNALREFCEVARFEDFWSSNLSFYRRLEERAKAALRPEEVVRRLEDYFGMGYDHYHVVLAPLFSGSYGCELEVEGETHLYAFLGPARVEGGFPCFDRYVLLHEFLHGFVNPVTEEFREAFRDGDYILKPVVEFMASIGYTKWDTVVNETVVRACSVRIMVERGSWSEALEREESRGFVYIRPVFELLAEYEAGRDRYRTFVDFYPRIVELFNTLAYVLRRLEELRRPPFRGPMSAALLFRDYLERLTIVAPSRVESDELRRRLREHIMHVKSLLEKGFQARVQVIEDVEALDSDMSGRALLVFGTPRSNLLLARIMPCLPFSISGDAIRLGGRTYRGEDLALVTTFYSPWDVRMPMLIYTGTRDESILDLPLVEEGDYAIYKGGELLARGRYIKRERWEAPSGDEGSSVA